MLTYVGADNSELATFCMSFASRVSSKRTSGYEMKRIPLKLPGTIVCERHSERRNHIYNGKSLFVTRVHLGDRQRFELSHVYEFQSEWLDYFAHFEQRVDSQGRLEGKDKIEVAETFGFSQVRFIWNEKERSCRKLIV